ncbi:FMR1-interacting protein NUFIP1-like [Clavelina lepadiformis]|uniref:C2H2-type domain-containing protein n=1 Tax=Clavelina lepadiformis TaxID=159417 RepID=A0ABP0GX76_CLALP
MEPSYNRPPRISGPSSSFYHGFSSSGPPGPYVNYPPFMPSHVQSEVATPNTFQNNFPMNFNQFQPCFRNHRPQFSPGNQHFRQKRYQSNNNFQKSKKPKEEQFIDYCDVCDRGFKTMEKKEEHYKEHTKCSEPGCSFEAHFKIVEIHKRNLHSANGFKIKIDTPEDIQKWKEERRRNFPTSSKIQEKLKEASDRESSGAVLQHQSFGKFRQRGNNRFHRGNRGRYSRGGRGKRNGRGAFHQTYSPGNGSDISQQQLPDKPPSLTSDELVYKQASNPLDLLFKSDDAVGSDSDTSANADVSKQQAQVSQVNAKPLNALGQLISNYDSDSSSEVDEKDKNDPSSARNVNVPSPRESTNEENVNNANKPPISCSEGRKQITKHTHNRDNFRRKPHSRLSKATLLEMLLEPEIRRERNDILQCIRHIVKNNFFE